MTFELRWRIASENRHVLIRIESDPLSCRWLENP